MRVSNSEACAILSLLIEQVATDHQEKRIHGPRIPVTAYTGDAYLKNAVEEIRQLVKHLSVACDFKKGGNTTTSIGLQHKLRGPCYWVSSNTSLDKIQKFLTDVLKLLADHATSQISNASDAATQSKLEWILFVKITDNNHEHLLEILKRLRLEIRKESKRLRTPAVTQAELHAYHKYLKHFMGTGQRNDLLSLGRLAYEARECEFVDKSFQRRLTISGGQSEHSEPQVRHHIGRLGCALRAAKFISSIAVSQPQLFVNFEVRLCSPRQVQRSLSIPSAWNIRELTALICTNDPDLYFRVKKVLTKLEKETGLLEEMRGLAREAHGKCKVHAELTVLEEMYAARAEFYHDDRFIGCSKPACFCCYHYFAAHPGQFVRPACHNRTWVKWLPPNVQADIMSARQSLRNEVLASIKQQLCGAAAHALLRQDTEFEWRRDSTNGMTNSSTSSGSRGVLAASSRNITRLAMPIR